jgi:hypothetical protein
MANENGELKRMFTTIQDTHQIDGVSTSSVDVPDATRRSNEQARKQTRIKYECSLSPTAHDEILNLKSDT